MTDLIIDIDESTTVLKKINHATEDFYLVVFSTNKDPYCITFDNFDELDTYWLYLTKYCNNHYPIVRN